MSLTQPVPHGRRRWLTALSRLSPRHIWSYEPVRRLFHFWVVWSALLVVHEGGHAFAASRQEIAVSRVTVGVGPVLWRGQHGDTELVVRLIPLAGMTNLGREGADASSGHADHAEAWSAWRHELTTLGGGALATLVLAMGVVLVVACTERMRGRRWRWGRLLIADAVILTVFNLLPIPPLDGGRAMLGAIAVWRGAPLAHDALFWVHVGGLALAVAPMTLWTRWTACIDRAVLRWGAPATD
jgi:membrane-associated protease RseP (regulator of RpoE activity)